MTAEAETYVTTDDNCRLWTERSGGSTASPTDAAENTEASTNEGFILCHGGPGFWDTLAPIADLLADYGPVIRWDQRGGGRSQHQGPYTLDRFIADVDAVRAAHGFDRVTLVGHSWGSALALNYTWDHPERVRSLIYISGAGLSWGGEWRRQFGVNFLKAMAPHAAKFGALNALDRPTAGQEREADSLRLLTDFPDKVTARAHIERLLSPYFLSDQEVNRALNAELRTLTEADLIERCRALPASMPVLIIDGARDPRPRWAVDPLAAVLPNVVRVTLESAGHLPWLDEPDAFAAAVREFVG